MLCREGNQVIHTFSPQRTEESFADRIGLRVLWWGFQHREPQVPDALVELPGENIIPVMDEEAIGVISWDGFAQLLQCP